VSITDTVDMGQGADEVRRMIGEDKVQRPTPRERRSGEWDWFDRLSPADRRWFGRTWMADVGARPEDVQHWNGYETVDAAMEALVSAAMMDRRTAARATASALAEAEAWEEADRRASVADVLAGLYGPQELATILGRTVQAVHQLQRRGRLPVPDLVVSKVPLWHANTLQAAGLMTGE
jgi:hypothetical protein